MLRAHACKRTSVSLRGDNRTTARVADNNSWLQGTRLYRVVYDCRMMSDLLQTLRLSALASLEDAVDKKMTKLKHPSLRKKRRMFFLKPRPATLATSQIHVHCMKIAQSEIGGHLSFGLRTFEPKCCANACLVRSKGLRTGKPMLAVCCNPCLPCLSLKQVRCMQNASYKGLWRQ